MLKALRFFPIACCLLLLLAGCGKTNKSLRYISKDASGIISINTGQLLQKAGLSMLSGSPMFKEIFSNASGDSASFNIEEMGVELFTGIVYAYAQPDQRLSSKSRFMVVVPLKDADKFGAFIKKQFKEAKIETKDKLSLATLDKNLCVGWDKNTAIIAATTPAPAWSDNGQLASDANNAVILAEEIQKTFSMPEEQSIASNKKFADLVKASNDISFWLNYESLMNSLPQDQLGTAGAVMGSQKKLLKDAFIAGGVNFEKGKITGDATYYFNPSVKAVAEALEAKSTNDDLLKKVQGNQLNLMMSYHINPMGVKIMLDTMGVLPLAGLGLKEYGLTLDDVLNAFSGDFLLAITDFSVTTESQSYTLAGSSVNYAKPVSSYKAVFSFKLKDKAAFDKLLQVAISNQMLASTAPNTYSAGFVHLVTNGDYVAISTEPAVAGAYLQSPGNAAFKVPVEVKNSPYGFFLDIRNSIQTAPLDLLYGKQDTALFKEGKNLLDAVSAHGGKVKGDHTDFHFEATFVNKDENSLLQIMRFYKKVREAESQDSDDIDDVVPGDDTTEAAVDTAAAAEAI